MKKHNTVVTVSVVILTLFVVFYVLYIGASILIPFVIALLLSFAIMSLSNFFIKKWLFAPLAFILSLATYGVLLWIVSQIINTNVQDIIKQSPVYQEKLISIAGKIAVYFSIDQTNIVSDITSKINIEEIISTIATGITNIVRSTGTIFFFTVFILLELRFFWRKMSLITENKQIFSIMEQIRQDMKTYFVIKTATSFSTGLLSYIVLWVFGIDFALFWAFLIFLLNYIPTIGSIIAVFFPVVFSIIQFESFSIFVLLLVSLSLVQMLIGNFLEPRFLGNKLNVSPLVILLSLLFWGQIWGVVGMLLCVPIVVIINIILAHIPATRSIAILLSEKWNIKIGDDDSLSKWRFMLKKMKKKIMKK